MWPGANLHPQGRPLGGRSRGEGRGVLPLDTQGTCLGSGGLAHRAGPTLGEGRRVWGTDFLSMPEWWDQEAATGAAGRGVSEALCPTRGVSREQAASGAGKLGPSGPASCCFPGAGEMDHPSWSISHWQINTSRRVSAQGSWTPCLAGPHPHPGESDQGSREWAPRAIRRDRRDQRRARPSLPSPPTPASHPLMEHGGFQVP